MEAGKLDWIGESGALVLDVTLGECVGLKGARELREHSRRVQPPEAEGRAE